MPTAIVKSTMRAPLASCLAAIGLSAACSSLSVATVCEGVPLLKNFDGTWESGYCWGYQLEPPDIGAFAEGFDGPGIVCGMGVYITGVLGMEVAEPDLFVYADEGGNPGQVLAFKDRAFVGGAGLWPSVVHYTAYIGALVDADRFFVGVQLWWGDCPPFIVADLDGPGGRPRTNVPMFQEALPGWTHPDEVWHDGCRSLGIEVYLEPFPTPVVETSWGSVKSLYR